MKTYGRIIGFAAAIGLMMVSVSFGAGSQSIQPETGKDVKYYNRGVDYLMDQDFTSAEKQFRKALEERWDFAEAHNNLAYVLRKQGPDHYEDALDHYKRAVDLKPDLAQPYMYRGVLHMLMGNEDKALADHRTLTSLNRKLADELQAAIASGEEPDGLDGLAKKW